MTDQERLDQLSINTIRTLAIDAIQKARSGHPGTPMGVAPAAYTLWQRFLRFDPDHPIWPNRDRFVLSSGHASMLLYALLHLTGVKAVNPKYEVLGEVSVSLDAIKSFRQLESKCPGHPEYRWTSGIETTTGPLGQGLATSVGMAIASHWMAQHFNRPGFTMFDYDVYALCGDGCMMEGISSEAASLAGHLRLANLCWIYDRNKVTIEGHTDLAFTEDVATRFLGYDWNVTRVSDANDQAAIERALTSFKRSTDRPTLIVVESHIGYGAPHKEDTSAAHGEPLGDEEVRLTKRNYGWPENAQFLVPDGVREHFQAGMGQRGHALRDAWMAKFVDYQRQYPELADQLMRMQRRELPDGWDQDLPVFPADAKGIASRDSSGQVLNALAQRVPWLMGGAADLFPSTKTRLTFPGAGDFQANSPAGRNFHFGIREHAMGAVINGLSLSKVRPFGSGFLIFSDYGRGSLRLGAIMEIPVIYVFTHDSIGVGEDGPTHQPVEHLASLRAIPGLITMRPGDANEVTEAWRVIMQFRHEPVALILSRQALPTLDRAKYAPASGVARGAYVLADAPGGKPDVLLLGTGSEVSLCADAYEKLTAEGIKARVVSMPSWELFDRQTQEYQDSVLPPSVTARVAVEQASTFGWHRYVGTAGEVIGMHTFGASAPLKELQKKFGFTPDRVLAAAKEQVARGGPPVKTLGFITIGQSPRDDYVPEMEKILGPDTRVVQAGALDGLSRSQIDALAPRGEGDALITRLRDGSSVIVVKQAILGLLQECLDRLDPEMDAAVLLCTGVFPRFRSSHPVLEPDRILYAAAEAVFDGGRLGVLIPIEAQRESMAARWRPIDPEATIAVASPYAGAAPLVEAAEALARAGVSLIAMSCMGYTQAMKALVRDVAGVPALLPTSLVARMAAEAL